MGLAGGPTRNGDEGQSFIYQGDGTTVSSRRRKSWLTNSVNEARLMLGDCIVVPEKLDKGVVLGGFKDWIQIISTIVVGAAAEKVLFP